MMPTGFYLETHQPHWLGLVDVPLFVSRRALERLRTLPRARAPWALDSGGFSELQMYGRWQISTAEYVALVRRYRDEIGQLAWAAPQDWMCEPLILQGGTVPARVRGGSLRFAGTGLSVAEHQRRTVDNLLELRALAPDVPWAPVVQGWGIWDYVRCVELYDKAGLNLRAEPVVGVGTVCRRQAGPTAHLIFSQLVEFGLRLHGFGVKSQGLQTYSHLLASADSMAWSDHAHRNPGLMPGHHLPGPGRPRGHINCANCIEWALEWRRSLLYTLPAGAGQLGLFTGDAA